MGYPTENVDILVLCPLPEELRALLEMLPEVQKLDPSGSDIRVYYRSNLTVELPSGQKGTYKIALMSLTATGRVNASTAASDALRRWNPKYLVLVGIAGGIVAQQVHLGDILVADQIVDYELQKINPTGSELRSQVYRADERLVNAARNFAGNWAATVKVKRPTKGAPRVHFGPVASGDNVIAAEEALAKLRGSWPKLIGVEMEAGGTAAATAQSGVNTGFFMVRGVSDLADSHKNSRRVIQWRSYACSVAAAYLVAFLRSGPFSPSLFDEDNGAQVREPATIEPEVQLRRITASHLHTILPVTDALTPIPSSDLRGDGLSRLSKKHIINLALLTLFLIALFWLAIRVSGQNDQAVLVAIGIVGTVIVAIVGRKRVTSILENYGEQLAVTIALIIFIFVTALFLIGSFIEMPISPDIPTTQIYENNTAGSQSEATRESHEVAVTEEPVHELLRDEALALAADSMQALENENNDLAMELALTAYNLLPHSSIVQYALLSATYAPGLRRQCGVSDDVESVSVAPVQQAYLSLGSGEIEVYDLTTCIRTGRRPGVCANHLLTQVLPENNEAVSICEENGRQQINLWDMNQAQIYLQLDLEETIDAFFVTKNNGSALTFSIIDAQGNNNIINRYDLVTEIKMPIRTMSSDVVSSIVANENGSLILIATTSGKLGLLEANADDSNTNLWLDIDDSYAVSLAIHPESQSAIAGLEDGRLLLLKYVDNRLVIFRTFRADGKINALAFSPDGRQALSVTENDKLSVWNLYSGALEQTLTPPPGALSQQIRLISSNGQYEVFSTPNSLVVWNLHSGEETVIPSGDAAPSAFAFASESRRLVWSSDRTLFFWNLEANQPIWTMPVSSEVDHVVVNDNGEIAVFSLKNGTLWLRRSDGSLSSVGIPNNNLITRLTLAPNGTSFAAGFSNGDVKVWNIAPLNLMEEFAHDVNGSPITSLLFVQNGNLLAGARNGDLKLFDIINGYDPISFIGHRDAVISLALVGDENVLSGSRDGSLKLWSAQGQELVTLARDLPNVISLGVDDQGFGYSTSIGGSVLRWILPDFDNLAIWARRLRGL